MATLVPEDLVRVLLNDRFSEIEALHVGVLPPSFPEDLVPPKVKRIVGGTTSRQNVSMAFELEAGADLFTISTAYERLGYQTDGFGGDGGFQQNVYRAMRKDRTQIMIMMIPPVATEQLVKVSVSEVLDPATFSRPLRVFDSPFPALTPPPGSISHGGGGGGNDSVRHANHELNTELPPADVLKHYEPQFKAAGWSTLDVHADPDHAFQWLAFTDKEGANWRGSISAVRHEEAISVFLVMSAAKDPERARRMAQEMEILFAQDHISEGTSTSHRAAPRRQRTQRPPDR